MTQGITPRQPQAPPRPSEETIAALGVIAAFVLFFVVAFAFLVGGVLLGWISLGP